MIPNPKRRPVVGRSSWSTGPLIATGAGAWTPAIDMSGQYAMVSNSGANTLSLVELKTGTILGSMATGAAPLGVAWHPDGMRVIVANSGGNTVDIVDVSTMTVIASRLVGGGPQCVAMHPSGAFAYVAVAGTGQLAKVMMTPPYAVTTFAVHFPGNTFDVAFNPQGTRAWACSASGPQVAEVDATTDTYLVSYTVGLSGHFGIAVDPTGERLIVTERASGSFYEMRPSDGFVWIYGGLMTEPIRCAYSVDGTLRLFADLAGVQIAKNVVGTVAVSFLASPAPAGPVDIRVSRDGRTAVVGCAGAGGVTVVDLVS